MNPAYLPPQQQQQYGGPPGGGYGSPQMGQGYAPPQPRGFPGAPPGVGGPGAPPGQMPQVQMMPPMGSGMGGQGQTGYQPASGPQPGSQPFGSPLPGPPSVGSVTNGPASLTPSQGPPHVGPPMAGQPPRTPSQTPGPQQNPHGGPPPSSHTPSQLANQMSGMNLGGAPPRTGVAGQGAPPQGSPGGPMKPGQFPQRSGPAGAPPGSFPPAVNGMPSSQSSPDSGSQMPPGLQTSSQPPTHQPGMPMRQPPMQQPQPPMQQPPMQQPPMQQPPMQQPPMQQPPMQQPPMQQPPMQQPPMQQPPMQQPPMQQPHMQQQPGVQQPPIAQPGSYRNGVSGPPPRPGPGRGPLPPMGSGPQMGGQPGGMPGMLGMPSMSGMPPMLSNLSSGMPGGMPGGMPPQTMPGQYPPQPGMGPQGYAQPGVPGSHMNKVYPPTNDVYQSGPQSPVGYSPPGGMYPGQQQQQQQRQRLDPANMPSPIQVMMEDQRTKGGVFATSLKGQTPPLVTTDFVCQDQGNASPRFMRSTMYNVPITSDIMKQTRIPLALVLSPLAKTEPQEMPPPVVNMGELGPVRCIRCKGYMCPFMQFVDGGRRFHCLLCKATTEVPAEYFQHLDHTGQRVDRFDRPELMLGTYEFVATKEYCKNETFPKPPALIFLIDVSYNNIKSGMVHLLCSQMKSLLKMLPIDTAVGATRTTMRVGFITYNNTVHFYNIKGCLAQPQMMVVGDVQDMFMPLLDGFLCDPEESESVIDALMEQIPAMFGDTRETETVLAPAVQAGMEALKAAECAGKLLVFHSSLPIAEAPGKLKNRDDRKLLGTDKEKTILAPQNTVYNNLGQECVGVGCSVDLFFFNNSYIDIATIGQVARLSGGEVYKYTYFQADIDGNRLIADLERNISRPIGFDAIMRVRTSTGVRATDFYGHFYMSNTTDMELGSIDCDKGVAVEIKHDDKLSEDDGVYIQVALLYTSCGGQRRLRIFNLSLKTCSQMADMFRTCDLDTLINFYSKLACYRLLEHTPKHVKDSLINACAQTLACYRKNCASPSSAGQLILPETMKLLPLYLNCLLKNDALSGGSDITIDDRSFVMQAVMTMDVPSSVAFFYPRLIPLHNIEADSNEIPLPIRCSIDNLQDNGVYLLENGIHMFLWLGLAVNAQYMQDVFGVPSAAQVDVERPSIPELDTPLSQTVRNVIEMVCAKRHRCMRLTLVRQRDKMEMVLKHFLVEDRGLDNSPSYVDFLCQMHKEIRSLLE